MPGQPVVIPGLQNKPMVFRERFLLRSAAHLRLSEKDLAPVRFDHLATNPVVLDRRRLTVEQFLPLAIHRERDIHHLIVRPMCVLSVPMIRESIPRSTGSQKPGHTVRCSSS